MILSEILLGHPIKWVIEPDDPMLLPATDDFSILNPLVYMRLPMKGRAQPVHWRVTGMINQRAYVSTDRVVIAPSWNDDEMFPEEQFQRLSAYLDRLRFASKQVALPRQLLAVHDFKVETLPQLVFPQPNQNFDGRMRKYITDWAVSASSVRRAGANSNPVPVFHSLMLDAIEALISSDYRRALLYGAIAMETLAGTRLDAQYEAQLKRGAEPSVRVVEFTKPGGETQRKDPVYALLRKHAGYAQLLHEVALYIMGRSLLAEDERLYQLALKLYRTRNRIAHTGDVPGEGDYFRPIAPDAYEGLRAALRVFVWFGDDGEYPFVTGDDFIPFDGAIHPDQPSRDRA